MSDAPAGFIPPEFREFIMEPMTDEELQRIVGTMGWYDREGRHNYSLEQLKAQQLEKIVAVRDTRDGSIHPTRTGPFLRYGI